MTRIEDLAVGDLVLSRDEFNLDGKVVANAVEEVFVHETLTWGIEVSENVINTTAEHPLCREGDGWTPMNLLHSGDRVRCEGGTWATVGKIKELNDWITVYNCRVAD